MATRSKAATDEAGSERRARSSGKADDVLAALLAGLEEVLPGIEVLDRELVFENGGRADLAAVDPSGRLVLVLVAGEDGERAVLETLDALHFARTNATILARHLTGRRINTLLAPRMVVVNPANDRTLVERLGALAGQSVDVFGVRTLQSAGGERSYLVQVGPTGVAEPTGEHGVEAFVQELPPGLRELGQRLCQRMGRLDEDLDAAADQNALVWRFRGELLTRVERVGSRLQAAVAPHLEAVPLTRPDDVERVIEASLGRLVELIGEPLALAHGSARGSAPRGADEPEPAPAGLPGRDEPLLTPEEIEAFRD